MIIRIRIRIRFRRVISDARFVHPMDPMPRTAVLASGFQETRLVRVFPLGWNEQAQLFHPTSVAGSVDELRKLTESGLGLEHAVVAFTYEGDGGLSHNDRELFWDAFGVPVYEQYLNAENELLATECDAHSGLHVMHGYDGLCLESDACGCGNPAPRLPYGARIDELAGMLA